jgi:hypothetical protein
MKEPTMSVGPLHHRRDGKTQRLRVTFHGGLYGSNQMQK